MNRTLKLLTLSSACVLASCACPKHSIDADAISGTLGPVLERHNSLITTSETIPDLDKTIYLRSSDIIRQIMRTALEDPNWPYLPPTPAPPPN